MARIERQWESAANVSERGLRAENHQVDDDDGGAEAWARTEAALVAAAQRDPAAFDQLYRHYVGPIYRYCAHRLNDSRAAEDATSDVFLRALRGLPGFRQGQFAAWLFQIAHNVIIDRYRRERPMQPSAECEPVDHDPGPDEAVIARDDAARLRAAIVRLPEAQRTALELQLAGWSTEEIGTVLGKSPATMRVFRFRALKQLRTLLHDSDDPGTEERADG
jgi:RNA polymerase sigma-70 factor (ECF subfamily)